MDPETVKGRPAHTPPLARGYVCVTLYATADSRPEVPTVRRGWHHLGPSGKFAFPTCTHVDTAAWWPEGSPWTAARAQAAPTWELTQFWGPAARLSGGVCQARVDGHQPFLLGVWSEGSGSTGDLLPLLLPSRPRPP